MFFALFRGMLYILAGACSNHMRQISREQHLLHRKTKKLQRRGRKRHSQLHMHYNRDLIYGVQKAGGDIARSCTEAREQVEREKRIKWLTYARIMKRMLGQIIVKCREE